MVDRGKVSLETDIGDEIEKVADKIAKGPREQPKAPEPSKEEGRKPCPYCGKKFKKLPHRCKKRPRSDSLMVNTCDGCLCNSGKGKRVLCDIGTKIGSNLCKKYGKKR